MIAALYIDPRGPYPKMVDVDCWDERRDARKYAGPWPVVAHPPCGPWGRLKFLNKHQDPSCGPRAVEQVRAFGGVLEHPEHSTLWRHCQLPRPGELPDAAGGFTIAVNQTAWGHRCKKATWLYCVSVSVTGIRTGGTVTHRVTNGSRGDTTLPRIGSLEARLTPPAFAEWLVSLARTSAALEAAKEKKVSDDMVNAMVEEIDAAVTAAKEVAAKAFTATVAQDAERVAAALGWCPTVNASGPAPWENGDDDLDARDAEVAIARTHHANLQDVIRARDAEMAELRAKLARAVEALERVSGMCGEHLK